MLFGRNQKNPITIANKGVVDWKYSTCGYCSTGCAIEIGLNKDGKAVASRGVANADVNRGKLCLKGICEHEILRIVRSRQNTVVAQPYPRRVPAKSGWDSAMDKMASEIKRIQATYGRDAFAVVSTGQILTEGFYTLGKLVRGVIGTNIMTATPRFAWPRPFQAISVRSVPTARRVAMKILNIPTV